MVAEEIAGKVEWRRPEMKQQRVRVKGGRGCGFGEIRALLEWCDKVILMKEYNANASWRHAKQRDK